MQRAARILVVEDDPNIRGLCTIALRDAGYTVETAIDGADAFARLDSPDLIVLDLMMPFMDGREFLRRLRAVTPDGGPPVLIMTAAPILLPVAGAQAVMSKPFDVTELLSRVAQLLD